MKNLNEKDILAILKVKHPDIWKALNTKAIENTGCHFGFSRHAEVLLVGIDSYISFRKKHTDLHVDLRSLEVNDHVSVNMTSYTCMAERNDFPLYYVSAPLMEAIARTHPPQNETWKDLTLPFEAMTFMLPIGSVKDDDESVIMIGYYRLPNEKQRFIIPGPGNNTLFRRSPETNMVIWWHGTSKASGAVTSFANFDDSLELGTPVNVDFKNPPKVYKDATPFNCDLELQVSSLLSNLLLIMTARPDLIENGGPTDRVLKSGLRVHRPTFIGHKYQTITKNDPQGGHFTELRWRAGHMKRQHFGPGNKETKLIFIDPYIAHSAGLVKEKV